MGYCWLAPVSISAYTKSLWNSVCRFQTISQPDLCVCSVVRHNDGHVCHRHFVCTNWTGTKWTGRYWESGHVSSAGIWQSHNVSSAVTGQLGCSVPDCQLLREFQAQLIMQLHAQLQFLGPTVTCQLNLALSWICSEPGWDTASATAGCTDKLELWWPST